MASSKMCNSDTCKRFAQALCYCCQQDLCSDHLKKHIDILNSQLISLADEINALSEQFNKVSLLEPSFITELDKWHQEAHRIVEYFYERKKQEFQECLEKQQIKQKTKLNELRSQIDKLIQEEGATHENICSIKRSLRFLRVQTDQLNYVSFTLSPLTIDDQLIVFHQHRFRLNDLLSLPPLSRIINEHINVDCLATNDKYLSVILNDHFCLLDRYLVPQLKIPWTHDCLWDIIWSKSLEQFILITAEEIYVFDEKTMTIGEYPVIRNNNKTNWWCGTCSNDTLFVSAMGRGVSISEYILRPIIKLVKEYQSPISCGLDEEIDDLSSNDHTLAIVIRTSQRDLRIDLCSINTFERFQSIQLGFSSGYRRIRCCSLINNHWLVINPRDGLYQISTNGKFNEKENYNPTPRCAVPFGNHFLAILTNGSINLHELYDDS